MFRGFTTDLLEKNVSTGGSSIWNLLLKIGKRTLT